MLPLPTACRKLTLPHHLQPLGPRPCTWDDAPTFMFPLTWPVDPRPAMSRKFCLACWGDPLIPRRDWLAWVRWMHNTHPALPLWSYLWFVIWRWGSGWCPPASCQTYPCRHNTRAPLFMLRSYISGPPFIWFMPSYYWRSKPYVFDAPGLLKWYSSKTWYQIVHVQYPNRHGIWAGKSCPFMFVKTFYAKMWTRMWLQSCKLYT